METGEEATQRLVLKVPVEEQQHSKPAAEQDDAYANHCQELSLDEQPRAQTTTPTRSLPPTTRPARAGGQCRAGPLQRLVAVLSVLCLTHPFLCANPEPSKDDENYNEELPKNVVVPLSSPLSVLEPSALSLNEEKPSAGSLHEVKPEDLTLQEIKSKKVSQNKIKSKKVSQNEIKSEKVPLNEIKNKDLPSLCAGSSPRISLSTRW